MNEQPRWLNVFHDLSTSSFVDILRRDHPHLLVEARIRPEDVATVPHGTTVLSVCRHRTRSFVVLRGR